MSAIQTLRNKSGLIIIVIGISLLAFIVTGLDPQMFQSGGNSDVVAEIAGEEYSYSDYYSVFETVEQQYKNNPQMAQNPFQMEGIYSTAWQQFINGKILDKKIVDNGLGIFNKYYNIIGISQDEFDDAITGNNIDPQIQQYFSNPKTGQVDRAAIVNFLKQLPQLKKDNPEFYNTWIEFEKSIHISKLQSKYLTLVAKSAYTTTLEAEFAIKEKNEQTDIALVKIPFETIPDASLKITDAELEAYYNKVKGSKKYEQDASIELSYVSFDVVPTQEDIEGIKKEMLSKASEFATTKNTAVFLNINSDIKFDQTYHKKGTLPVSVDSFAFSNAVNAITPLYLDGNTYKISKISAVTMMADSAKVRHILISGNNAQAKADSLKAVIEKGGDFAALALKYSADSGSAKMGGLIDWFKAGQMVPSFQDTSFMGVKGKIYLAPSQYGIHIIDILEQGVKSKQVQVQHFAKAITYSNATLKSVKNKAVAFRSENSTADAFNASLEKNKEIVKRTAIVTENQRSIPGVPDSRDVIRWGHQNKENKNDISEIFVCGDKMIIAIVSKVFEKGSMPFESAKEMVRAEVIKEKKIAAIKAKLKFVNAQTALPQIASKLGVTVDTAKNISFSMQSTQEFGFEPKVIATASVLKNGVRSQLIEGNSAVFYVAVMQKKTVAASADIATEKQMLQQRNASVLGNSIFKVLEEKAEIKDYRINFN